MHFVRLVDFFTSGADNVDADDYLRPQPSVDYDASHQANQLSSSNLTVTTNDHCPSQEYCYVTAPSVQFQLHMSQFHASSQDADANGYMVPNFYANKD